MSSATLEAATMEIAFKKMNSKHGNFYKDQKMKYMFFNYQNNKEWSQFSEGTNEKHKIEFLFLI